MDQYYIVLYNHFHSSAMHLICNGNLFCKVILIPTHIYHAVRLS
jgi:hypothetical protein